MSDHLDGYMYRGWTLRAEEDREDFSATRTNYWAERPGARVLLDWSPFQRFTRRHFELMVEHGFPRRSGIAPLFPADVEALAAECASTRRETRSTCDNDKAGS